jgi:hypothetical protein
MVFVLVPFFYVLFTFFGMRHKWNRFVCAAVSGVLLIGALFYVNYNHLVPAIKELEQDQKESLFFGNASGENNHNAKDDAEFGFLVIPFLLPLIMLDTLFQLIDLIGIIVILGFCTMFFILASSSTLTFLTRSWTIGALALLTQCFFVGGFLITIRVIFEFFPHWELSTYAIFGIIGAFASAPVPLVGYLLLLWKRKRRAHAIK